MSKTILAEVDGWTPLIDAVVLDVGLITAAVFGKAWRYCQMSDGVCKASQDRIAHEMGLSRPTINIHFSKLVSNGYLKDMTPNLLGLPHVYADTGKANLSISLTGGVKQIDRGCKESLQVGVKDLYTKKVVKKELKKDSRKVVVKATKKKKPATATSSGEKIKNPFYKDNLAMCARMAITQPKADEVANATPFSGVQVDPEFIRQHVETLVLGESLGLAIRRILGGEAPRPYPTKRQSFTLEELRGIQP